MKTSGGMFKCKNCGSERYKVRYDFSVKKILQCDLCKLMTLDSIPTNEDLRQIYNEDYFFNKGLVKTDVNGVFGYVDYAAERVNKQVGYKKICKTIKGYMAEPRLSMPSLLDFGCGLGYFLETAHDFGFEARGIEFNRFAVNYIKEKYGYDVELFDENRLFRRKYDVITFFDVIEHLREPFKTVEEAHGALEEDGIIVIVTLDAESLIARIFGKRLEDFRRISEHIYFFSKKNLMEFLSDTGFEILKIRSIGHTFRMDHLASRLNTILPVTARATQKAIKVVPPLGRINLYVNSFTKFIIYARKKKAIL